jgi:uncharacterized phage protein (TIGR01671 family)
MNDRFKFRVWSEEDCGYMESNDIFRLTHSGKLVFNNDSLNREPECNPKRYICELCTGLKDKNGKLIYEGDIVIKSDVSAIGYSRTRVCKVHWHNDWLSWAITTQYGDTYELSEFEPQQYEVIGNIHENADLIKVGGK